MRMRLAQEAAKAGAWEWRLADNHDSVVGTRCGLVRVTEIRAVEAIVETWESLIHPADHERLIAEAWRAVSARSGV